MLLLLLVVGNYNLDAQTFKIDTIQFKGDVNKYINVVILGDGYTSAEQTLFKSDAANYVNNFMFSQTPYKEYKNYFNVFLIEVPSAESGIKHPRTASDYPAAGTHPVSNPNNYFGTTFDVGGIHRLVSPNETKVSTVLANNFPNYDQAYIIANSSQYGGAGGQFATFTTNASSGEIGLHEGGHSFGALADEYWAGAQYAMEKPNMTKETSPTLVKWKNWMNVNGIGINPHTGDASWKKPRSGECKMEVLGKPFCSVCSETIVEKIHSLVKPVYQQAPIQSNVFIANQTINFSILYMLPISNTMSTRWLLDGTASAKNQVSFFTWTTSGKVIGINKDAISIDGSTLTNGQHKLKVYTLDTTALTRSDKHPGDHLDSVIWIVNVTPMGIEVNQGTISGLKLYPNPVKDQVTVQFALEKEQHVVTNVYSLDGKRIQTYEDNLSKGDHQRQLNLGAFSSGAYLVEIRSDEFSITQRILKE